jgi:hypothetical protein
MSWSVPEVGTNLGTNSNREEFSDGQLGEKVVGRDGIEPPTPGFSVLSPTSRKCTKVFDLEQQGRDGLVRWSVLE